MNPLLKLSTDSFVVSKGDVSMHVQRVNDWDDELWQAKCEVSWFQVSRRVRGHFDDVRAWASYVVDQLDSINRAYEEMLAGYREDANAALAYADKILQGEAGMGLEG